MTATKRRRAIGQRNTASQVETWDEMHAAWRAGRKSRYRPTADGMPGTAASGDWHYQNEDEFLRQMEVVREHERNDPVVNAALNRLTANVCQDGYTLDPQTGDAETDERLKEDWIEWSEDPRRCDRRGTLPFNGIAELTFRSMVRDGDCFVVPLKSGSLKVYEGHRVRTPHGAADGVVHGVKLDSHRRPLAYHFTREPVEPGHPSDLVGDVDRVSAFDSLGRPQVFHVGCPKRESQTRGVGWMAPSIDVVEMSANIHFAKMVQQQTVSCYSLMIKRTQGYNPLEGEGRDVGEEERQAYLEKLLTPLDEIRPGTIYDPLPGEELVGFSPNVPNPEFFDHASLLLTFLAINIDLPLAVLMLDPSKTNFSGWRGAIDQARVSWRSMQRRHIGQLHRLTYRWWVNHKLATEPWLQEKFRGGVPVDAHEWKAPAWDYIEPEKDAKADQLVVQSGMSTRRRRLSRRGESYDDEMPAIFAELESELVACVDIADRVNRRMAGKNAGQPLDVREIAVARGVLPNPNPTTLSAAPVGDGEGGKEDAA